MFLRLLVILLATSALLPGDERPNLILIMADDLGYETIGANGGTSYDTPVLNRLAAEGMRFTHCYSQPLCTPSRVQIMTGQYNVRNYDRFGYLDPDEVTFGNLLREAGYATAVVGKWQLGGDHDAPGHFGFDTYALWQMTLGRTYADGRDSRYPGPILDIDGETRAFGPDDYGPDLVVDHAIRFIETARHSGTPFFLYYPMILPHCPFLPTPGSEDWESGYEISYTYKGDPAYFGEMVNYMDFLVGRITATLDRLGVRENTLLLFTGDNGTDKPVVSWMNGREIAGQKGMTTDGGTRVPLVASWPGIVPPGSVSRDLVDFSDFLPTLLDAAGVALPETGMMDGRSFLPQLLGQPGNPREWVYCWYSRSGETEEAQVFARNRRYKLYADGRLFDVWTDPQETRPVGPRTPEAPEIRKVLQAVIDQNAEIEAARAR